MIDVDRLHSVATRMPYTPRGMGKSYFNIVCLVQSLELRKDIDIVFYVCASLRNIGNSICMLLEICKDMDILIDRVTHDTITTEFGKIKVISLEALPIRGIRNHLVIKEID